MGELPAGAGAYPKYKLLSDSTVRGVFLCQPRTHHTPHHVWRFGLITLAKREILSSKRINVDAAPNLNRMDSTSMLTNIYTQFNYVLCMYKVFFLMLSQLLLLLLPLPLHNWRYPHPATIIYLNA